MDGINCTDCGDFFYNKEELIEHLYQELKNAKQELDAIYENMY